MVNKVKIIQKVALIYEEKILCLQRSFKDDARPGTWDLVGGNVDDEDIQTSSGDILINALKREVREEIDVDLKDLKVDAVYVDSGINSEGGLIIWIGYECFLEEKPKVKISDEHEEFKWVTNKEFVKLDFGFAKDSFIGITNKINL